MAKIRDIIPTYSPERLENLFEVSLDANGNYFFNLTETVQFDDDIPAELLGKFIVQGRLSWHNISYQIYGTTNLWWAILAINKTYSPMVLPEVGSAIYFIEKSTLISILDKLK